MTVPTLKQDPDQSYSGLHYVGVLQQQQWKKIGCDVQSIGNDSFNYSLLVVFSMRSSRTSCSSTGSKIFFFCPREPMHAIFHKEHQMGN